MPTIADLVVRVRADIKQFQAGMAQSTATTEGAATGISKFGAAAVAAYAVAGTAVLKFAQSAVQSAEEHQQVLALLQTQVGKNTQAFETQATALQNVTGFQDELVLSADTVLKRFHLTDLQVRQLIPTILDYARATGKDVPEAATAVGRALMGNARALKTVGIDFTATGDATKDYNTILGLLQEKVGGTAQAFGKTLAGQIEILKARFDDLKETIGGALIPILNSLVQTAIDVVDAFDRLAKSDLVHFLNNVTPGLFQLLTRLQQVTEAGGESADRLHRVASVLLGPFGYAMTRGTATTNDLKDATSGLADAQQQAAAAARDQKLAEQALAGGLLGLVADQKELADAQRTVNQLKEKGKQGTEAYKDAVLGELQAILQLKDDLRTYAENLRASGDTAQEVQNKVMRLGHQFGLTRQDIMSVLGPANELVDTLRRIPTQVTTHVDIFTTTHGTGHPLPMQAGGIVTSPTVALIGEHGPEAVVPLNKGGGLVGDITLVVDSQVLARITRDQLLKLQARNATTGLSR